MLRALVISAVALGFTTAAHAEFDEAELALEMHGALGKGDAKQLLALLDDTAAMLADAETAARHLAPVASFEFINGYASTMDTRPGIATLDLDRRADRPVGATIDLIFDEADDRARFLAGLDRIYGAPDAACSNERSVNWQLAPDMSATWHALDYGTIEAQLSLQASDPLDANCARSLTGADKLLVTAEIEAFLRRVSAEPPPLGTAEELGQWLTPYTVIEINDRDACDIRVNAPFETTGVTGLEGFAGMNGVVAALRPCGLEAGNGHSMVAVTSFFGADMFGEAKFAAVADRLFGARYAPCSDRNQQAWAVNEDTSLIVNNAYLSFSASIYPVAVDKAGCVLDYRVE